MLGTASWLALLGAGGRALELMLEVSLERGTRAGRRGNAKCFTGQHVNKSRAYSRKLGVVIGPQRTVEVCVQHELSAGLLPTQNAQLLPLALPPSATGIFLDR